MSEHQPISRVEYETLIRNAVPAGYIREIVNNHIKYSGEHHPVSKEEEFDLKRAHFAAIRRKELDPFDLNTGGKQKRLYFW